MRATGLLVALALVAWLSAGAMAVRSASRIWLRHWAERRLRGSAAVLVYLERPQRLLAAANAGIALTLGMAGVSLGWRLAEAPGAATVNAITYAAVVIVVGFIVPRVLARRFPSLFVPVCMPFLRVAEVATAPLLTVGRFLSGASRDEELKRKTPRDALRDLLREGELEGLGSNAEIAIITGVVEFGDKRVRDVMTPIADVLAVSEREDPTRVAALIAESKFSRIPVFQGTIARVVGMYHAFDVLKASGEALPPLRPVAFAAAATPCNELLLGMLTGRRHLAVVQDDAGRAIGIVTLEDLLEELVGEIRDEHDEPEGVSRSRDNRRSADDDIGVQPEVGGQPTIHPAGGT